MRVQGINSFVHCGQVKNASFKGLWGKTTYYNTSDSSANSDNTYYSYFPFKDETEKEIKAVVKKKEFHDFYCADSMSVVDPIPQYTDCYVNVHDKLPFTKQDFENFQNCTGSSLKRKVIQNLILEKDLDVKPH